MRDKLKGSDTDTERAADEQGRREQPGTQSTTRQADALDKSGNVDEQKLKENRGRLQVDDDHKTPDMKKGHRGTFP